MAVRFPRHSPTGARPSSRSGRAACLAIVLALSALTSSAAAQTAAPGGFLELATSTTIRPRTAPVLPQRGTFLFPAPYSTLAARLTNAADCGGNDCVNYVGYSYWRNSNNHVGSDTMLIVITLDRHRGGAGPTLFSYDKRTDQVSVIGPVFPASHPLSWGTGEGWYWSGTAPTKLYVNQGPQLLRYDVLAGQFETVLDVTAQFGADRYVWQAHSSADDRVHSATLRSSTTYEMLGCVVYKEATRAFTYFPKIGDFDECQVDKSGRWLVIKENVDGVYGEDNRIIDLDTGAERRFLDQEGAGGHSDMGHGYMIAEDNWHAQPGAVRVWSFAGALPGVPPQGQLVYRTTDWALNIGHISHGNARPGVPLDQQFACGGQGTRAVVPRANEILCFRLDASQQVLVVAPTMTDLNAAGGGDDYAKLPKGNLDVTGQYFIWTTNAGGNRLDAFVVKVPSHLLVAGSGGGGGGDAPPADTTAPVVTISAPGSGGAIVGSIGVSASASDNVGVAGVQFMLNGANLGAEVTAAPYTITWNSATAANGVHTLTAVARDAAGNTATSNSLAVTVANGQPTDVTWINLVKAMVTGTTLRKIAGCNGCPDAGGASKQTVKGTGSLELVDVENTALRYVGLGAGTLGHRSNEIRYAFTFRPGGLVEIREHATYRAETRVVPGDVLRITISNGVAKYWKNGTMLYKSTLAVPAELRALASLYSTSAVVSRAAITSGY